MSTEPKVRLFDLVIGAVIGWAVLTLLTSCGEYDVRNDRVLEQQLACQVMAPEVADCPDYVATIRVVFVDEAHLKAVCDNPLASACARYSNATIYVLEESNVSQCSLIVHEFMHFLGRHYYDNGDQDHNDFNFDLAYDKCDAVNGGN